jgi:DNA repair protein RecO (recombination protein O)
LSRELHKTKGFVLRITKYGETSLIALIYTETFGMQSYLVQGVRSGIGKKQYQTNYFQPGAILDLIVYHHEQKSLQRIKEFKWAYIYDSLLSDVVKNSIMLYMIELIIKTIRQPETNQNLFDFIEDSLLWLDHCPLEKAANLPIYFALHLSGLLGFQLNHDHKEENNILDLVNGKFISEIPAHTQIHQGLIIEQIKELMKVMHPDELTEISLNRNMRKEILDLLEKYYSIHLPEFGKMKTLPILKQLMD